MKIASIQKVFVEDLNDLYGPEEAASIAWLAIEFVCQINRSQYLNSKNNDLSDFELKAFYKILTDLKVNIPIQYILGETEFYGSIFKVNPSVLIPRPETEELVDWVLKDLKLLKSDPAKLKIIDIGTGSGCIPISLKKYCPDAEVSAIDISSSALATAMENAVLNQVTVNFVEDDIVHPRLKEKGFSIIISNPPYVTFGEMKEMHPNVLEHEPHTALFVPDSKPLVFYEAIADFALISLEDEGFLYLEINENLGAETLSLLEAKGFTALELRKDLRDKDRMIKAQLNRKQAL